jgi:hypothetical protein
MFSQVRELKGYLAIAEADHAQGVEGYPHPMSFVSTFQRYIWGPKHGIAG